MLYIDQLDTKSIFLSTRQVHFLLSLSLPLSFHGGRGQIKTRAKVERAAHSQSGTLYGIKFPYHMWTENMAILKPYINVDEKYILIIFSCDDSSLVVVGYGRQNV